MFYFLFYFRHQLWWTRVPINEILTVKLWIDGETCEKLLRTYRGKVLFYFELIFISMCLWHVILKLEYVDSNMFRILHNFTFSPNVMPKTSISNFEKKICMWFQIFFYLLQVWFGLSVHHIIDVDEKNQILTVNCWVSIWFIMQGPSWQNVFFLLIPGNRNKYTS